MARLWNLSRQRPHHHRVSCAGECRRDQASCGHCRTGPAGCIGQAGLTRRGRPDPAVRRRGEASRAFADAPDADLRKTILRRRSRRRRHPGRRRQVASAPPAAVPRDLRRRFGTVIGDVATTGNSGSGVFDARNQCLLGIISRKISVGLRSEGFGAPARTIDIAKYFVPASVIKAFIPLGVSF